MNVGYARISTSEQRLDLQTDALKKCECQKIFSDIGSGSNFNRQGLQDAISFMREGDCLVVWRLDRLGRSLKDLIEVVNKIHENKMSFRSLQENIETTSISGKLTFHIFSALSEFEKNLTLERTKAGLAAARARGRFGGRPRILDAGKIKLARTMASDKGNSIKDICKTLNVSRPTLYRYLRQAC